MVSAVSVPPSRHGAGAPLGNIGNRLPLTQVAPYKLQKIAAAWLPDFSVAICGRNVRRDCEKPGYGPRIGWTVGQRGAWLDLHVCGSVWVCPVCAWRICEQRRSELQRGVDRWQGLGGSVLQVVYTLPHGRHDRLDALDALFMRAMKRMAGTRAFTKLLDRWQRVHHVYAQEVTVSDFNGWHTHRHDLWFAAPGGPVSHVQAEDFDTFAAKLEGEIFPHWDRACRAEGLKVRKPKHFRKHGVKVTVGYAGVADYIAKWGREPAKKWGLAAELAKGPTKRAHATHYTPFGLLAAAHELPQDEPKLREWFREFADAYKGKRQLVWSRGAKEALGIEEVDDAAAAEQQGEFEEELQTYAAEWVAVRHVHAEERVILAAIEDGRAGVLREIARAISLLPDTLRPWVVPLPGGRFRFNSTAYADMAAGP